jgi:dCTP diphosphatase
MKKMNLSELEQEINQFVTERDWDQFHTLKNLVCALNVESSELLEIFQWLKDEQVDEFMQDSKKREKVEDEIADIFVYLMRILSKTNIDLEQVVRKKMAKNAAKYPVELAKGNSKKYTDF